MMDDIEAIMYRDLKKQYELARPIIRRVVISVEVARLALLKLQCAMDGAIQCSFNLTDFIFYVHFE